MRLASVYVTLGTWVIMFGALQSVEDPFPTAVNLALATAVAVAAGILMHVIRKGELNTDRWARKHGWVRRDNGLNCENEFHQHRTQDYGQDFGPGGLSGTWRGKVAATSGETVWVALTRQVPRIEIHWRPDGPASLAESRITTESPEFDERFRVDCANREYAYAVVHPRMIARLLEPSARELGVTIDGDKVSVSAKMKTVGTRVEDQLNLACDVADLLPQHVNGQWGPIGDRNAGAGLPQGEAWTPNPKPSTTKNWLAWVAGLLVVTVVLMPVGIVFAHKAVAAARRGEASNGGSARMWMVMGYLMVAIVVLGAIGQRIADRV